MSRGGSGYFTCIRNMKLVTQGNYHSTILRSAPTLYLRVLYVSQNKQRLFPYTALTDWFV